MSTMTMKQYLKQQAQFDPMTTPSKADRLKEISVPQNEQREQELVELLKEAKGYISGAGWQKLGKRIDAVVTGD